METLKNNDDKPLQNWTKDEKWELLQALRENGSRDIDQLSIMVCSKSKDEIKAALEYYRNKALEQSQPVKEKKSKDKNASYVPLSKWAKFISDNQNFEELQTETATALRLIAEFEDKPPAVCTEKIDFKRVYYVIADAIEGKSLPEDKHIKAVMQECVLETALTSKAFLRSTTFKQILKSINMSEKSLNYFPKPTDNKELANLRHLASQKSYNPLSIPDNYLKSSFT